MNGQYLCNRAITVSYAYKKDTKGERHGTLAGMHLIPRGQLVFGCNVQLALISESWGGRGMMVSCGNLKLVS